MVCNRVITLKARSLTVSAFTLCVTGAAQAVCGSQPPPAFAACFDQAAGRYGVDARLLKAIATVESNGNPRAVNRANGNGSHDIGLMQINSRWLPTLAQWGIDRSALHDACLNIHVGAWVLAQNQQTFGATWRAVGAYNARDEGKRAAYVDRVWKVYRSCSES